jgi:hypothetical protein
VIIKLINYGGRLGENIQSNLNITSYKISENVHSDGSLYASGKGGGGAKGREKFSNNI